MHFSFSVGRLAAFFAVCAFAFSAAAQSNQPTGFVAPTGSFAEAERSFNEWRSTHHLSTEKGWKQYARWQHYQAQRQNPDGSIAHTNTLHREATRVAEWKKRNATAVRGGSGWIPVGPDVLPPGADPNRQHGMGRINCITFHPTDANTFWVGVAQGGVWKTVDNGANWQPLTDDLPILRINDITVDPQHPDTMYIAVGDYGYLGVGLAEDDRKRHTHFGMGVYKSTDGGTSWAPTSLGYNLTDFDGSLIRRTFVHPDSSHMLLAAGIEGIFTSNDAGDTWTTVMDSVIWDIEADPSNPTTLYATGGFISNLNIGHTTIYKSTDFGATWTELNTGILPQNEVQRVEVCVAPSNPNYVYAIGCGMTRGLYAVWRSTDAGQTWQQRLSGDVLNILNWSDGADLYSGQGTYDLVLSVHPQDEERIYAGGINLWTSGDGGTSWQGASYWVGYYGPSLHADQHFLAANPITNEFYMCNDGGLYRTDSIQGANWADIENGGQWPTDWENLSDGLAITSFYRLGLSANNTGRLIAGAQDNSTYVTDGASWLNIIGGDGMECIRHPNNPSILWGSYQYGTIVKSQDGGLSTQNISGQITWNYDDEGEWTTPYVLHPQNPDMMVAGYGQVYVSYDGGDLWVPISNWPNMQGAQNASPASALAVAPSSTNTIYVAKRIYHGYNQPTEVWRTTDLGNSWTNITTGLPDSLYITYLAVDDNYPDRAWATCGGFVDGVKVFRTDDGGQTWQNISNNLPNLPVNTIVHHNQSLHNTVYVGMDVGIFYTNDTLPGWELYSDNLPNAIVSELEIDYTNEQIYAATFGRGVWKADALPIEIDTVPAPIDTIPTDTNPPALVTAAMLHGLQLQATPSPSPGNPLVTITGTLAEGAQLRVIDINGRVVYTQRVPAVKQQQTLRLDTELPPGVYFLQLTNGTAFKAQKLVISD